MSSVSILAPYPNLFVKQTKKGWLRNCLGCEAPTELKVATIEQPKSDFLTIQEHSSCLLRLCMPGHHPFVMNVTQGDRGNGPLVMKVERPLKCTPFPLKCCCFQQVKIIDNKSQQYSGSVMETFWVCIPQYGVYDAQNTLQYHIHMPSCCFCLPNCCAEGCCRVPFYIYKPDLNNVDHVGKIVKVWGSITSELIGAHRFQVEFPPDSDEFTKARMLGATLLINELYFKVEEDKQSPV